MEMEFIGYHGTKNKSVSNILMYGYKLSGEDEWFGKGVYFFVDAKPYSNGYSEARLWAIHVKRFKKWAVLQSEIIGDNYIDLIKNVKHKNLYDKICKEMYALHVKSKVPNDFLENIVFKKISEKQNIDFILAFADAGKPHEYYTPVVRRLQAQLCVKKIECIKKSKLFRKYTEGEKDEFRD